MYIFINKKGLYKLIFSKLDSKWTWFKNNATVWIVTDSVCIEVLKVQ